MTRKEHLNWCKKRALQYINSGDVQGSYGSMVADLDKHPETQNHAAIELGMMLIMGGKLKTANEMKKFINGFN